MPRKIGAPTIWSSTLPQRQSAEVRSFVISHRLQSTLEPLRDNPAAPLLCMIDPAAVPNNLRDRYQSVSGLSETCESGQTSALRQKLPFPPNRIATRNGVRRLRP